MAKRGVILAPLLIAAAEGRRYKGGDKELSAYARKQADALISGWVTEDRADGRSCASATEGKRALGWRAVDYLARTSPVVLPPG